MFSGGRRRSSVGCRDLTVMEVKMQKLQQADVTAQQVATPSWLVARTVPDHAETLKRSQHAESRKCFRNVKVMRQD